MNKTIKLMMLGVSSSLLLLSGCISEGNDEANNNKVKWDLSLWGGQRAITLPADDWAKAMYDRTDGKWEITVHYGATLSNPQDNLDNLSSGLFEAAAVSPFYTPGKLPLTQVMDLPFIMPTEFGDIVQVAQEMFKDDVIKEELDSWNIMSLLPGMTPQYEYMGKSKIETVDDFNGVKIAGMSADIGKVFAKYGAIPTPMPAPELYSSLEYGTIDGVVFPYSYGMGSYNLYEVSDYGATKIAAGSPVTTFFANKDAWDALPEEFKKIHNDYIENDYLANAKNHIKTSDINFEKKFKEKGVEIIDFSEEERSKLLASSKEIWDDWSEGWSNRGDTKHLINKIQEVKENIKNGSKNNETN